VDPITELNPSEAMTDPRKKKEKKEGEASEIEEVTYQIINDQTVMAGIDPKFNALRVFPPDLNYPDVTRDKNFF